MSDTLTMPADENALEQLLLEVYLRGMASGAASIALTFMNAGRDDPPTEDMLTAGNAIGRQLVASVEHDPAPRQISLDLVRRVANGESRDAADAHPPLELQPVCPGCGQVH